jgi:hypothetical protein
VRPSSSLSSERVRRLGSGMISSRSSKSSFRSSKPSSSSSPYSSSSVSRGPKVSSSLAATSLQKRAACVVM